MRLLRGARRFKCETPHRRTPRRSMLKKWLAVSHKDDAPCVRCYTPHDVRHALFSLGGTRRTPGSPRAPSLKKTQSPFAVKWSLCVEALRPRDANGTKARRRVGFVETVQEFARPVYTMEEKALYHYSADELGTLAAFANQSVSRFAGQPQDTILDQGFLRFAGHAPCVQGKRYYCLLRGHRLDFYTSAAHALKKSGKKTELTILRVQDCAQLSRKQQGALFGASVPPHLCRMFYVIKANGERVVLTAETERAKCNWVHSLTRLTYVGEGEEQHVVPPSRSRSSSAPTKRTLPSVPEVECEEDWPDPVAAFSGSEAERRNSCTADYR